MPDGASFYICKFNVIQRFSPSWRSVATDSHLLMDKIQSLSYFNDHALRWFEWKQVHQTHAFTLMRTFSTAFSTNYQVFSKLVLTFQECVWCCCIIIILNSSYFLFTLGVKKRGRKKKHQRFKLWMLYCSCTCRIFSFEYIASDGINFKCFFKWKSK